MQFFFSFEFFTFLIFVLFTIQGFVLLLRDKKKKIGLILLYFLFALFNSGGFINILVGYRMFIIGLNPIYKLISVVSVVGLLGIWIYVNGKAIKRLK